MGVGRDFGISQKSLMHNSFFFVGFPSAFSFFSMQCCIMMLSFNCDRSYLMMKILLLNFQYTRRDNFSLAKSEKIPVMEFNFFLKNELVQSYFSKHGSPTIFKRYCLLCFKALFSFNSAYFNEHFLLAGLQWQVASYAIAQFYLAKLLKVYLSNHCSPVKNGEHHKMK